jgi:hypothetical protein
MHEGNFLSGEKGNYFTLLITLPGLARSRLANPGSSCCNATFKITYYFRIPERLAFDHK